MRWMNCTRQWKTNKVYCIMALVCTLRCISRRGYASAFTFAPPTAKTCIVNTDSRKTATVRYLINNVNRRGYYGSQARYMSTSSSSSGSSVGLEESSSEKKNNRPLSDWYLEEGKEYELPDCESELRQLKEGQRIVAFGDVHGDLEKLRQFLVTAGVMDPDSPVEDPVWCGGDTICVQTGDILDRGDEELACFRLLTSLSRQAFTAGGKLILLYGNHESLNAVGLFHYANPGGNMEMEQSVGELLDDSLQSNRWRLQFAGNQPSRWAAFEPGGLLAHSLLSQMKVAVVVGHTVFVHAGLTTSHLQEGGITGINAAAQRWIATAHHGDNDNMGSSYQSVDQVIAAANQRARQASYTQPPCLGGGIGDMSPIWMRTYSQPHDAPPTNPKAQQMIDGVLFNLNCQRMVMGHTPQHQINVALNNKAWRIDVGASKGVMNGHVEVLEIIHSTTQPDTISILRHNHPTKIPSTERQIKAPQSEPTNIYDAIF